MLEVIKPLIEEISYANQKMLTKPTLDKIANGGEIEQEYNEDTLTVRYGSEIAIIPYRAIIYIEKINNKVKIICEDVRYEYYISLRKIKEQLKDELFIQCHQSFIINKSRIAKLHQKTLSARANYSIWVVT